MPMPTPNRSQDDARPSRQWRIGCVSYLNAKPVIHGLDIQPGVSVRYDVPSNLLEALLAGQVDIALCPVIDYYRNQARLAVVPVGGICSAGQTFTVRLYSRVPLEEITHVHVDTDSHTSVALLQILLKERYGVTPQLIPFDVAKRVASHQPLVDQPAMLLIGDKVVTDGPSTLDYPHQLDLGQAWNKHTGLPFVFATWLAMIDQPLGDLPAQLNHQRELNHPLRSQIADEYAPLHHWPADLARRYLTTLLHYQVGDAELQAMALFASKAHELGLVPLPAPAVLRSCE